MTHLASDCRNVTLAAGTPDSNYDGIGIIITCLGMDIGRLSGFSDRINAENPAIGELISVEGRKLHYVTGGDPDAPVLVLLHGASGNLRDWTSSVFEPLTRDWRVIAFDRPGYGHSQLLAHGSWQIEAQTRVLQAALAGLGVMQYALFGHSYGVAVALNWVLERPGEVTGIIAMSGAMTSWTGALGWRYRWGGVPVIGRMMAAAVPAVASDALLERELAEVFAPQIMPEGYVDRGGVRLALRPETFALNLRAMDQLHPQTTATLHRIPEVSCPVEILHGGADAIIPFVAGDLPIAGLAQNTNTVILDDIGHMPHHVATEDVVAAAGRLRARI